MLINFPYTSPNTKFVEPPSLLDSWLQVITGKKIASQDNRTQTKSSSRPNYKTTLVSAENIVDE